MAETRKVIITCAITGSIHTPSMSPYLPVTPREIADAAVAAADAGAAIVHLHARDPVDGHPTQDPKYFREFAPDIKRRSDVVINFTTGGAATMTIEERLQPALQLKPEVASLNMGSMNFGLYPMLKRFKEFRHPWEREYLEGSDSRVFRNTFRDIEYILTSCADNGTRFEIECYDIGHLYTAHHFFERGIVAPPLFIQSVFGILGGIGPHPDDVMHMKRTADRLFGDQYRWSVLGAGRNQLPIAAMAAAMGGNVRVGLEDSLWLGPGKLAESNAAQVRAVRQVIEGLGLAVATPSDAVNVYVTLSARQINPALVIHTRAAAEDTLAIMRDERADEAGGVMHCFTETWDVAQAALDLGFHISFSGIVTFRNATALKDVATRVPLERMLIETDSPYLAPVPHRGKTNEPAYVPHVAAEIARLRGVPVAAIAAATTANFFRLFGIDPAPVPAAGAAGPSTALPAASHP